MLIIAIASLVLDPKNPVIYKGTRIGMSGRRFVMYKFRTLKRGAEQMIGANLFREGQNLETTLGKLLRFTKLDELPQLINIVKGDMSFIGPRPERPVRFFEHIKRIEGWEQRLEVKPGLSGPAQIEGDYYSSAEEKFIWDMMWVRKRSNALYFKYIFKTIFSISNKVADKAFSDLKKASPWVSVVMLMLTRALFSNFTF